MGSNSTLERVGKLEETIKKQRLAYDNLQQQFVLQVEKISNLEKQIKQYKTDKLEYETKYEERVFFMEQKSKEKKEAIRKELMVSAGDFSTEFSGRNPSVEDW